MIILDTHAWIWWVSDPQPLQHANNRELFPLLMFGTSLYLNPETSWRM